MIPRCAPIAISANVSVDPKPPPSPTASARSNCSPRVADHGGEATGADMDKDYLTLKRAPIGPNVEDYDVLCGGDVVGRIFLSQAAPQDRQWMWTLAYGQHEDRTPTHGYEPTREAAMEAFAKSWRRE
jgi:hypothetical protein